MKNDEKNLAWTLVDREHLIQDEWIDFRKDRYRLPDGREFEPFYNYSRRSYVVIVAEDEDGNYLCVRQYRHGISRITVEFSAGGIEKEEEADALEAAKRELLEETGYASEDWVHLLTVPSHATICENDAHLYYARNCKKVADLSLDETEFLESSVLTEEQIEEAIQDGSFAQSVHILAWLLAKRI